MRIYYGWVVTAICSLVLLLVMGSTVSVYGLYVLPAAHEFGLNRADVNTAFVIANLGGALQAPLMGRLVDTRPIRVVMTIGALCFAGSMIVIGLSHSIWLNAAVLATAMPWAIGGLGTSCCMALVARWFEAQRARAMALAFIGMSLGAVVMSPLVGWMIETVGWRNCLMLNGAAVGGLFLLLILLVRDRPGPLDIEPLPRSAPPVAPPQRQEARAVMTAGQILRMPIFWLMALGMGFYMSVTQTISITLVPMAQEGGISVTASAGLLSILGMAGIASKFVLVVIGDRFDKALVLMALLCGIAGVVAALPHAHSYAALAACAGAFGLLSGVTMPLLLALLADYMGSDSFASANGMATFVIAIFGALAMRFSGEMYDRTGGYGAVFLALSAVVLLASVMLFLCWRRTRRDGRLQVA